MSDSTRLKYLRIALVLVGIIFIFGIYSLMIAWLGWTWHTGHSDYPLMIVGIYATLGVFLILAARAPGGRSGSREPPME
jgi:apolipoprotein N-acyltransferase